MLSRLCLAAVLATALGAALPASAQPTLVESGWTLIRSLDFVNPIGAHYNPVDGRIYVASRETAADGLYRIDANGFSQQVAAGTYLAAALCDPATGNVFSSDAYVGTIYRSQIGVLGRTTWVSGFHTGDDDPMGMAIAPPDYTGGVIAPGQAIVVDGGYSSSPDEIWAWSPATAEGEVMLLADNGVLVEATDVAIDATSIYIVDGGETASGAIFRLDPGGILTPVALSQTLADPQGITIDPWTGDLIVLECASDRVVRVNRATGAVSDLATAVACSTGWAGVDMTPDGRQLIVSAYDADKIYVFARCDAAGDPVADCDGNGVYDACDIAEGAADCNRNGVPDTCDLSHGTSDDCDLDGVPDDCPVCPPVEVVFVMDTSTSMDDEATALCASLQQVIAQLEAADLEVFPRLLSICNLPGGAYACLEERIDLLLGTAVPGDPPAELALLGNCSGPLEGCNEDWALATAVVAGLYPWQPPAQSVRLIIPVSDEGPWCGDPVTQLDTDAIAHAILVAQTAGVIVSPITGSGATAAVVALAQSLATGTGGQHFSSTAPALDVAGSIVDLVICACATYTDCNANGTLDECDIAGGFSQDHNGNGIPDECEAVGVPQVVPGVDTIQLGQNVPNPFNPSTTITFTLPRASTVDLAVFALDGRRVASLVSGALGAGTHQAVWNGRDDRGRQVASGAYVYRLQGDGVAIQRPLVLLK